MARLQGDDHTPADAGQEKRNEIGGQDEAALIEELFPVEGPPDGAPQGIREQEAELPDVGHRASRPADHRVTTPNTPKRHPTSGDSPILISLYTLFATGL